MGDTAIHDIFQKTEGRKPNIASKSFNNLSTPVEKWIEFFYNVVMYHFILNHSGKNDIRAENYDSITFCDCTKRVYLVLEI